MLITGTFLDEISHDIPHQNWGIEEWDSDFATMKKIGIDTVILIRCGHKKWQTFNSSILTNAGCYQPPVDLVSQFLDLSEKYDMKFFFGLYDSGSFFETGDYKEELEINIPLIEEVWEKYGTRKAFQGWYISQETSRNSESIIKIYNDQAKRCKEVSGGLPTLISPFIDGRKALSSSISDTKKDKSLSPEQHFTEWNEIFDGIRDNIDIVAFQDGQVDYDELPEFLEVNRILAEKFGIESWGNIESFDRDMPIKFLPIKWEKMLLKLDAARIAGVKKLITFEFSHFMSPQSCYPQARYLYERYCEHFKLQT